MRFLIGILFLISSSFAQVEELKKEAEKLKQIRDEIKATYQKNEALLEQIKKEKQALELLKKEIEESKKKIQDERYKKLAKVFEKMDPEMAGQKLSKMESAEDAAYIIFNMNEKKAAAVLDNTDPVMVSKIVKILTRLKEENDIKN
jgi:flagellar motility protein MotE (MotC chaperone)